MKDVHLFLEGPSGSGKTTLLLNELGSLRLRAGGFVTQRLLEEDETRAFCLASPSLSESPQLPFSASVPHQFIRRTEVGLSWHAEVFLSAGLEFLRDAERQELLLLDEIGGCELLLPVFRARLLKILKNDTPCVGVLKSPEGACRTSKALKLAPSFEPIYRDFRTRLLSDSRTTLIEMTTETRENARRCVHRFLEGFRSEKRSGISR